MSDQMLSLYGLDRVANVDDEAPFSAVSSRTEALERVRESRNFDLLILGGGLTGALVAHEASLQGIKVLLLECGYFGSDAVSWDVRISHQLRSSPVGLFRAAGVLKALATHRAPHLVEKMPVDSHPFSGKIAKIVQRLVPLVDVNERLLIRETVVAARQEGGVILAATRPVYLEAESSGSGCYLVGFEDQLSGDSFEARVGGVFIDPTHGSIPPSRLGTYSIPFTAPVSAGVQMVYEAIPRSSKGGLPFVSFELTDGSYVALQRHGIGMLTVSVLWGDIELTAEQLAVVIDDAIREAGWLVQDELSRRSLAGKWSSRYSVSQFRGIFTCSHRGAWDAFKTASTIIQTLVALSPEPRPFRAMSPRLLPGGQQNCETDAFRALARAQGLSEQTIERVVSRWRGRVRYLSQFPNGLREFVPGILRGEVELAVRSDQVVSLDDLAIGALELQAIPGWRERLSALSERLSAFAEGEGV